MSRRSTYTRPNNYVKFARKGGVRSTAKLAKAVAGLNRARKMQIMRAAPVRVLGFQARRGIQLKQHKYFDTVILAQDTSIGSDSVAATLVKSVCIVPEGNTVNQRQGKKLRCLRLQYKGSFEVVAGTTSNTKFRVSWVWDREPDKAALVPTTTDIYDSNAASALTNRDNAPRFKILKEDVFTFPAIVAATSPGTEKAIQDYSGYMDFTKKDMEVIWTKLDTTGAVANMVKGDLLCVFTSDEVLANGAVFGFLNARLDFQDSSSQ